MKVYVVFWSDGETDVLEQGFTSQKKAREYVEFKNNTTELSWFHEEMEVSE
jgi:hypothetical protein